MFFTIAYTHSYDNLEAQARVYFKQFVSEKSSVSVKKLKDCCFMQYGYTETATDNPTGTRFLRITDVSQPHIDWSSVPYCNITDENKNKYLLSDGDIVVARTGATVGMAKMLGKRIPESVFASFLVRIKPFDELYKYFFGIAITSPEFLEYVQMNAGGSAQPQANPPLLGEFEIPVVDKEDIIEFNVNISSYLNIKEINEIEIAKLNELKETLITMISSR